MASELDLEGWHVEVDAFANLVLLDLDQILLLFCYLEVGIRFANIEVNHGDTGNKIKRSDLKRCEHLNVMIRRVDEENINFSLLHTGEAWIPESA